MVIVNDTFHGGTHLPDITVVEAVFDDSGQPLFYAVNRAHHADVGGRNPGSMGFVSDIADEGVLIPPTLLSCRGVINNDFLDRFLAGVRNPEERKGDLRAQLAALKRGKTRLLELHAKYVSTTLPQSLAN